MPPPSLVSVLRHLRRTAAAAAGLDDSVLLERFVADRDEAAFELLVWRHGPLVLGVCRRRLNDIHAAEDAFQATFLALARRAKSIRRQASVAGWLYRVAGRVALAARQRSAQRAEQPLVEMTPPGRELEPADAMALRELRRTLDDAIGRLPARYRDALVLTCFAGRSHAEAAQQLGCAVRTIESRLGRARQKLRAVLLLRGFLPAGGLAAALIPADAPAGVATSLVMATVRAVGKGAVSSSIDALTEGVLHAMLLSKLKIAGSMMFVAGFVGLGTGGWVYQSRAVGQAPTVEPIPPPSSRPTSDKQDRKQRVKDLLRQLNEETVGGDPPDIVITYLEGWLKAKRDERAQLERDRLVAQQLRAIDEAVKKLKVIAGDDPSKGMVVSIEGFEDSVRRFKDMLHVTDAAIEGILKVPVAPAAKFSAGMGLRGFNFGTAVEKRASDANVGDDYVPVNMVNGDLIIVEGGSGRGLSAGMQLPIYRLVPGQQPKELVRVTILHVNTVEAVGRLGPLPKGTEIYLGDAVRIPKSPPNP